MLSSTAKRAAKFNTNNIKNIRAIVSEALKKSDANFLPNNVEGSFRVVTNLGRVIGSKGQTSVRVIVGNNGKIWNAFPVNVR